jgi:hypothetical protein
MQQNLIFETAMAQKTIQQLTFKVPELEGLFPCFQAGDFAIVYGFPGLATVRGDLESDAGADPETT